ncbi:hypothetical protein BV898_00040 [Hypsibius exemplaris]|uniref:Matrix-remodeling-associated protein 7 helical domain-containing protein n=1 Tax=Hypsibius exemplaris TaxID=2072580 RepID=A0A1W0XEK3_HYPEX|nr:hypothetical protein BV898_00040 [Hypsibius exemplaris]
MKVEEMKKLAWDVWEVYRGWGNWVYLRYRPYKVYVTLPNVAMLAVTLAAIIWATLFLAKRHSKRRRDFYFQQNQGLIKQEDIFEAHMAERETKLKTKFKSKGPFTSMDSDPLSKLSDGCGRGDQEVRSSGAMGQPVNCPFKHLFGGMMESDEQSAHTTSQDQETMSMLRDQIHKSINRPGEGETPAQHTGSYADLFDRDSGDEDESQVEELTYRTKDGRDPFEMAAHIPGELKKIQNKITTREMEKRLTEEQRKEEAQARREQLEQIFKLMQNQKDKFGAQNTDDIEEQMRMYSL